MQIIDDSLGWEGMQQLLPLLKQIADRHGVRIANVATLNFDLTEEALQTIHDFIGRYPTPEGDCCWLERNSPRYKGIILTDRNNVAH